jgi:hypothetical protein
VGPGDDETEGNAETEGSKGSAGYNETKGDTETNETGRVEGVNETEGADVSDGTAGTEGDNTTETVVVSDTIFTICMGNCMCTRPNVSSTPPSMEAVTPSCNTPCAIIFEPDVSHDSTGCVVSVGSNSVCVLGDVPRCAIHMDIDM